MHYPRHLLRVLLPSMLQVAGGFCYTLPAAAVGRSRGIVEREGAGAGAGRGCGWGYGRGCGADTDTDTDTGTDTVSVYTAVRAARYRHRRCHPHALIRADDNTIIRKQYAKNTLKIRKIRKIRYLDISIALTYWYILLISHESTDTVTVNGTNVST
ncbi:hypothetical protein B484DRAFT_425879, partial [Ochromonadaceae sp. CCMP2298]